MKDSRIQVGQVWKKDDTGETYLVTKVYNEALTTFAVLRRTGAETEKPIKARVVRQGSAQSIPGFTNAQANDDF